MVHGHKSAADTDSQDGGTGKTYSRTVPVLQFKLFLNLMYLILFYRIMGQ